MSTKHSKTDVILIGGGIMSATLGTILNNAFLSSLTQLEMLLQQQAVNRYRQP